VGARPAIRRVVLSERYSLAVVGPRRWCRLCWEDAAGDGPQVASEWRSGGSAYSACTALLLDLPRKLLVYRRHTMVPGSVSPSSQGFDQFTPIPLI